MKRVYGLTTLLCGLLACGKGSVLAPVPVTTTALSATAECARTPAGRQLRRLSGYEYNNALRDLLRSDDLPAATFFVDTAASGFDNDSTQLTVTGVLPLELMYSAEKVADFAVQHLDRFMPCDGATAACGQDFIRTFGRRAWRRPLADAEQASLLQLFTEALPGGLEPAVHVVLRAMFTYPDFLYRFELGDKGPTQRYTLTQFETATELAFLLTESTPDDALLDAAERGALAAPEALANQAARLLLTPRADAAMLHFFDQWLRLDTILTVPKDLQAVALSTDLRQAMLEETHRLILDVWRSGGGLTELLTAQRTYLNDPLALFYGLGPVGSADFVQVPTPSPVGILGQGAITAGQAMPAMSSPVRRGRLVRTRLLCQGVPPPPPTIPALLPPTAEQHTTRQVFQEHSNNPICSGCHTLMDPMGFAFEGYDAFGRARTQENGYPIDSSGQINAIAPGAAPIPVAGLPDLARQLAAHPATTQCLADMVGTYAYAQDQTDNTRCVSDQLGLAARGASLQQLFLSVTRTRDFFERSE